MILLIVLISLGSAIASDDITNGSVDNDNTLISDDVSFYLGEENPGDDFSNPSTDPDSGDDSGTVPGGDDTSTFHDLQVEIEAAGKSGELTLEKSMYINTGTESQISISQNIIINSKETGTIIDAQGYSRIFNIMKGATVTLNGLTLKNGLVSGDLLKVELFIQKVF